MHACKPLWQRIAGIVPSGGFFFVEMTTALFRFLCRSFLLSVLTLCRLPFPPSLTLLFFLCHPSFPSVSLFVLTILNNLCNLIHSFLSLTRFLSWLSNLTHSSLSHHLQRPLLLTPTLLSTLSLVVILSALDAWPSRGVYYFRAWKQKACL